MARITKLQVSLAGFQRTVAAMAEARRTTIPDELNRQMLKVLVGAKGTQGLVQLTKKASESEIKAELAKTVTYGIHGKQSFTNRLSRVLAAQALYAKGGFKNVTRANLDAMEKVIIAARVRSRAFMAASWLFSAFDLAKSVPGNDLNRQDSIPMTTAAKKKRASDADADPATARKESVTVYNTAEGTNKVGKSAIVRALNNARLDMIQYLGRKLGAAVAKLKRRM